MQIAILSGVYTEASADMARSYPINMSPVAEAGAGEGTGVSKGYLRINPGIRTTAFFTGQDRGGLVWNDKQYRVLGTTLVSVNDAGIYTPIGEVGFGGAVSFGVGFGRFAIAASGRLYYYDGTTLTQVTDPDLGLVLSVTWQDGYYITTDGDSIVVTELNDPTSIDPLKYGSAEADPDPLVAVLSLRGELYAMGRSTIEVFVNRGTTGFPFDRNRGAQIPKGCAGPAAFAPFGDSFAFVGADRNEGPRVYIAGSGQAIPISPRAVDKELAALTADELASVEVEARTSSGFQELLVHLPKRTWVYDAIASQILGVQAWHIWQGGAAFDTPWPARHYILQGGKWWAAGKDQIGFQDPTCNTLLGQPYGWQFDTPLLYNEGRGALVHDLELVTLAGRSNGTAFLSHTDDGRTWSNERAVIYGGVGDRTHRLAWRRLGRLRNWRSFRFRGLASGQVAFARLEARLEPLDG